MNMSMTNYPPSGSDTAGSVTQFDRNWNERSEARYNHWVSGLPSNQIQLAFRQHWELFSEIMHGARSGRCLEVGCGRGSISSYFADNGFDCVLLDSSKSVLETAKSIFQHNGHQATFVHGDALCLPFHQGSFDVVVSIGLLEHFENVSAVISEQVRVLRPGGLFLGYVVPERVDNIQRYFGWINCLLKYFRCFAGAIHKSAMESPKCAVYRSDYDSRHYKAAFQGQPVEGLTSFGVYPLPMISHSPKFPFSLLPKPMEFALTRLFEIVLLLRRAVLRKNPWICRENLGQAFLLTCRKVTA